MKTNWVVNYCTHLFTCIYGGHFRSNITVPVASLCRIQFSKTIPPFVQLYITYKMFKCKTKIMLSLKILIYIYGRYKYTGRKTD